MLPGLIAQTAIYFDRRHVHRAGELLGGITQGYVMNARYGFSWAYWRF